MKKPMEFTKRSNKNFYNTWIFFDKNLPYLLNQRHDVDFSTIFAAMIKRLFNNTSLRVSTAAKIAAENSCTGHVFIILLHFQLTGSMEIIRRCVCTCYGERKNKSKPSDKH